MTTQLDFQVGMKKETVYGTPVAVDHFFDSEAKGKYDLKRMDGRTVRPTRRVTSINRTTVTQKSGSIGIDIEATTKNMGILLNSFFGAITNTTVPATTPTLFQQVHTLMTTDPIDSYTIQELIPLLGGGAAQPHTFVGSVADTLDISVKNGDFLSLVIGYLCKDMVTTEAAAVAAYPTGDALFSFIHGAIKIGGSYTAPTTTALASLSGSNLVNITDWSISAKNNLDSGGFNLGGAGARTRKNALGAADVSGKITAEYTDNTLRDAYLNQTPLPMIATFTNPVDSSVLQIINEAILLDGEVPASNGGAPITQSIPFKAYDPAAGQPIRVVYRTQDTTP